MVPVIYAPEAERDLDAITAYIAKRIIPKRLNSLGIALSHVRSCSAFFQSLEVPCTASATSAFCWKLRFKFTTV